MAHLLVSYIRSYSILLYMLYIYMLYGAGAGASCSYARLAKASLELWDATAATKALSAGLKLEPSNKDLKALQRTLQEITTPLLSS